MPERDRSEAKSGALYLVLAIFLPLSVADAVTVGAHISGRMTFLADRPYSVDCSTDFARLHIDATTVDRACALAMPSISAGKMQ
jgi:hypothetical protein